VKCKNKACDLPSMHSGKCQRLTERIDAARAINEGRLHPFEAASLSVREGEAHGTPDSRSHKARREVECAGVKGASAGVVRTPNRRDRESYNAYMREYMRKRRQKVTP
jgi:hypothetical protein